MMSAGNRYRWRDIGFYLPAIGLSLPVFTIIAGAVWPLDDVQLAHFLSLPLERYLLNSLILIIGVGSITLLIGVSTAWWVSVYEFPGRGILEWALLLPLAVPAYLLAMVYIQLLNESGPVQQWWREWLDVSYGEYMFPDIYSIEAAIVLLSLAFYPYVYLLARAAFLSQSPEYKELAMLAGRKRQQYFRRIVLPMARPAIVIGVALVIMEVLADFGTLYLLGVESFTTAIYRAWYGLGEPMIAARLSAGLLLMVAAVLWLERSMRKHKRYNSPDGNSGRRAAKIRLPKMTGILVTVFCAIPPVLGCVVPCLVMIALVLPEPEQLLSALIFHALYYSVLVAGSVILVVWVCATLFACRLRPQPAKPSDALLVRLATLGYAIPGSVIAVGVFVPLLFLDKSLASLMEQVTGERGELLLTGSIAAMVIACTIRFLTIGFGALETAFGGISHRLDDSARLLGAGGMNMLSRIHLPLLRSEYAFIAFIIFSEVLKELPASYLLRPFNVDTLAIRTFELAQDNHYAAASGTALWMVAVSLLAVMVLATLTVSGGKRWRIMQAVS